MENLKGKPAICGLCPHGCWVRASVSGGKLVSVLLMNLFIIIVRNALKRKEDAGRKFSGVPLTRGKSVVSSFIDKYYR